MSYALVDIGNSSIKAQVFKSNKMAYACYVNQDDASLALFFKDLSIDTFVVASVVPSLTKKIQKINPAGCFWVTHAHCHPLIIQPQPKEGVGIDRLVNALAAYHKWKDSRVIIDVGSYITACYLTGDGVYHGGCIMPGISLMAEAMVRGSEQLDWVSMPTNKPPLIGKNTQAAMASGLFYAGVSSVESIVSTIQNQYPNTRIILTGGDAGLVSPYLPDVDVHHQLMFEGLQIIYQTHCT